MSKYLLFRLIQIAGTFEVSAISFHSTKNHQMQLITAPEALDIQHRSVFLAGSIEQDVAERWQDRVITALSNLDVTIFNPRRKEWDASWVQSIDNHNFHEQVSWELSALEKADIVIVYFDKNTKSPITLMELGLYANTDKSVLVCCPDGFWRKGNVDIVCQRYNVPQCDSLELMITELKNLIQK